MLALRLILLMDQGNKWARNQLCNEILSIEDEADLATACFELNSLFPHFAEHFVRYVEDKALGVSAKTLAAINARVQLQRAVHAIA
jgi:hypothetical protein